ncbi:MAG TPA: NifU family protein [Ktedonobacteraceae bacterium]|nr:NifU family protein [Ktedonobacteraceae bacterium]
MQQDVQEHLRRAERIETLIQEVSTFPDPHVRATTGELIQALLDMYGEGLARILELTYQSQVAGNTLIETFVQDDLLSSLFMLHGLHPVDLEERIAQALVEVRPYLQSHGGNVELVRVEDGIAYLRLEGSCHGCPASTITLRLAIEEAIYKAAPDLDGLEVEGVVEPPHQTGRTMPVTFVPRRQKANAQAETDDEVWTVLEGLDKGQQSPLQTIVVRQQSLLFCSIAGNYYAYHNRCSSCGASLSDGTLEGTSLICPSCGRSYDMCRAGRCLDAPALFLEPVPLLVEDGKVKVALSTGDRQSQAALSAL